MWAFEDNAAVRWSVCDGLKSEYGDEEASWGCFELLISRWVNCNLVFTTQIGFVAVAVQIPALAAARRCTHAASCPPLKKCAMICFPFP